MGRKKINYEWKNQIIKDLPADGFLLLKSYLVLCLNNKIKIRMSLILSIYRRFFEQLFWKILVVIHGPNILSCPSP